MTILCLLSNGEVIKYHQFISAVVIELSVRCLNTGLPHRLCALVVVVVFFSEKNI